MQSVLDEYYQSVSSISAISQFRFININYHSACHYFEFSRDKKFYIGAYNPTDGDDTALWVWRSDDSAIVYSNWKENNPDKNNKEACAILDTDKEGKWDDHECDHEEDGYICEGDTGIYSSIYYT